MAAEGGATELPLLCPVKDADNDDFVFTPIEFVHNDVGKTRNRPFVGATDAAGMAKMRKFREPVAIGEDAPYDVRGGRWTAMRKVEPDSVDMGERFKREAQFHDWNFCLTALTSPSVTSRVDPSRRPRRMRWTSAT